MDEDDERRSSPEEATQAALQLLSRRLRTRQELREALARKHYAQTAIEAALEQLESWRYLDDARLADARALALLRQGRVGAEGVTTRLQAQGVAREVAEAAVRAAVEAEGHDPLATARALLQKRGLLDPATARDRARGLRLLLGRGFAESVVHALLGDPALDPPGEGD